MSNPPLQLSRGTAAYRAVILALFLAGFASFSLLYCVQPMLPELAHSFLLRPSESSFALSFSTLALAFGLLITGFISDALGRKPIMVCSLLGASILTILSSFIPSWWFFLLSRIAIGLSVSGVAAVAMTYVAEEVRPVDIGFSMGLYISGTAIGGMSGRLMSGVLLEYISWHHVILFLGILNLAMSILFYYLLPDSRFFQATAFSLKKLGKGFQLHLKNPQLCILFAQAFILMGCFVTVYNYLNYYLLQPPFNVAQSTLGLLAAAYLAGIYSSPRAAAWAQRFGRKHLLIFMLCSMLIALWFMASVHQFWILCIGLVMFTFAFFAAHSTASSWVSQTAKSQRAVAASLYLFSYYFGSSFLGSSGGLVWESYGWFGLSLALSLVLCLGIVLATRLHDIRD
ncbi:MAG: MFS transporter [Acinetobacter populi]|jgi:YNFM family putative membrane transporter|uniref:MFS transporter n=1 Tax=Acinetobacter populi TaxID=1582270 RepID=UPI002354D8B2|nr:MFS transporter [Acinetobacter populi]MCH4248926.1 MFS transporter [Acinetobacter populi]